LDYAEIGKRDTADGYETNQKIKNFLTTLHLGSKNYMPETSISFLKPEVHILKKDG